MGFFGGGSSGGGGSPGPNTVGSAAVIDKSLLPIDLQDGTIPGQLLVTDTANEWTRSPAPAVTPSVQPVFMLAGDAARPDAPVVIAQLASGGTGNLQEWRATAGSIVSRISASGAVFHSSTLTVGAAVIPANTQLAIFPAAAAVRGLLIQGVASQTANLVEIQNSASQIISRLDPAGKFQSARFILQVPSVGAPDLSLIPVTGGQSVLAAWHGLQINALRLATPDYSPANISGADDYHVIIPLNQASKVGVGIRAKAGQTGDLQHWQDSAGVVLARISAAGVLFGNGSGLTNVPVSVHTHDAGAVISGLLDGDRLPAISATKNGAVPPTGMPAGKFLRDDGTWQAVLSGGDVFGPASNNDGFVPVWNGNNSKTLSGGVSIGGAFGLVQANENGNVPAGLLSGTLPVLDGFNLTNVVAASLDSNYSVPAENLPSAITYRGNTFNAADQLVLLDSGGNLPALNASALTQIQAANIVGTLDGDVLPSISTDKRGGVPATGSPDGKYLRDDGTWQTINASYALISEDTGNNTVTLSNGSQFGALRLGSIVLEGVYPVTIFAPPNGQAEQYTWPAFQTSQGNLSIGDLVLTHANGLMAWKAYAG